MLPAKSCFFLLFHFFFSFHKKNLPFGRPFYSSSRKRAASGFFRISRISSSVG